MGKRGGVSGTGSEGGGSERVMWTRVSNVLRAFFG